MQHPRLTPSVGFQHHSTMVSLGRVFLCAIQSTYFYVISINYFFMVPINRVWEHSAQKGRLKI